MSIAFKIGATEIRSHLIEDLLKEDSFVSVPFGDIYYRVLNLYRQKTGMKDHVSKKAVLMELKKCGFRVYLQGGETFVDIDSACNEIANAEELTVEIEEMEE